MIVTIPCTWLGITIQASKLISFRIVADRNHSSRSSAMRLEAFSTPT
jgi:hypothetical protein